MSVFTPMALFAGLYLLVFGGVLHMLTGSKPLKLLSDELAYRVKQSIAVLDECSPQSRAKSSS